MRFRTDIRGDIAVVGTSVAVPIHGNGRVLTTDNEPLPILSLPHIAGPTFLSRDQHFALCGQVLLIHPRQRDVRGDEPNVVDVVPHGSVRERLRQHFSSEFRNSVAADQTNTARTDPYGLVVEQRQETLDVLTALGTFQLRNTCN